jgi:hypothetical protein
MPRGSVVTVVGFDMDDYPKKSGGAILMVEGGTGKQRYFERYPSRRIAKKYFPLLFQELEQQLQEQEEETRQHANCTHATCEWMRRNVPPGFPWKETT